MARSARGRSKPESTENAEASAPENQESTVTETQPVDEPAEAATEAPIDLTDFSAAVATAVASRDTATGVVSVEQIELVKAAYHALPTTKAKNAAKKTLHEDLKTAVSAMDVVTGKAVMSISDSLTERAKASTGESTPRTPRAPADPAAAFKLRVTSAHLAYQLVANDCPEGVDSDKVLAEVGESVDSLTDAANTYYAWLQSTDEDKGDEPEVPQAVKIAAKMALGKAARATSSGRPKSVTSTGERGNIVKHILGVAAKTEPGTFLLIGEFAKASSDEYPNGNVSAGAVSGRLFPSDGKPLNADLVGVVQPGENDKGKKGATVLPR